MKLTALKGFNFLIEGSVSNFLLLGVCTYRMAEIWHGDCGMIVNVKNIRSTRTPSVAYTRTVYVTVGADTIVIDQERKITVSNPHQEYCCI